MLYQCLTFGQIVCKRLFNQNRDAGVNAQPALGRMKRGWCRQNDAIWLDSLDKLETYYETGVGKKGVSFYLRAAFAMELTERAGGVLAVALYARRGSSSA